MPQPRPSAKDLARTASASPLEVLASTLGKLIGPTGFDVMLRRALKLAAREDPALASVRTSLGGHLDGLPEPPDERARCEVLVLSHILELLMKLIGEDLTTRVVKDAWSVVVDEGDSTETK